MSDSIDQSSFSGDVVEYPFVSGIVFGWRNKEIGMVSKHHYLSLECLV
jgi:hypothetical protein